MKLQFKTTRLESSGRREGRGTKGGGHRQRHPPQMTSCHKVNSGLLGGSASVDSRVLTQPEQEPLRSRLRPGAGAAAAQLRKVSGIVAVAGKEL